MNFSQWYHKAIRKITITAKRSSGRYLPRIECHITDHCNLNCSGCTHFSNISPEKYKDIQEFERELACLSQKLLIDQLKLLGGEPLLHPRLTEFLIIARKYLPKAEIVICTNCLLLDKMGDAFWDAVRENRVCFVLSIYPPLRDKMEYFKEYLSERNVTVAGIHIADDFWAGRNRKGDSDPKTAYKGCQSSYCKNLRNGRLYICPEACYMDIYNNYFHQNIPVDKGIDIYQNSGREIVKYLSEYKETCKYCTAVSVHPWRQSQKEADEWDAVRS